MSDRDTFYHMGADITRFLRGTDQYSFEIEELPKLSGMSWQQRWTDIREKVFAKHNVGESKTLIMPRRSTIEGYPDPKIVEQIYRPALESFVDGIEKELDTNKNSSERGFRLAVVDYVLGVMMHPAIDGNGQTMRLHALSYIHEHCPEYKNKYFPIKYTFDPAETKLKGWRDKILDELNFDDPPEPGLDPETLKLINLFKAVMAIHGKLIMGEIARTDEIKNLSPILDELEVTMLDVDSKKQFLPDHALSKYISKAISDKHPEYIYKMYPEVADRKSWFLTYMLLGKHGSEALANYINTGKCNTNNSTESEETCFRIANDIFDTVLGQMKEALTNEDSEAHRDNNIKAIVNSKIIEV